MNKSVRMACVSDIHLGHNRTPTANIIANLDAHINNAAFFTTIDVLILAGDVWDQLLSFASPEGRLGVHWISTLLRRAAKYGVQIIVLEGTPSHDRRQSVWFTETANKLRQAGIEGIEVLYVDELAVKYLEKFDMHVLFVPDEWGPNTQDTLDQVRDLLAKEGLEQVDMAVMHGMFEYQLDADIPHIPRHDSIAYHGLVKGPIFIGHVHTFSRHNRIIAQGSFDRLGQGEEEAKGFVRVHLHPSYDFECEFIENTGAQRYVTVTCSHDDVTDNLVAIERAVRDLPNDSFVRLSAPSGHAVLSNLAVLRERWPLLNWSTIAKDREVKKQEVVLDHKKIYVPLVINRQNITEIVQTRLHNRGYPAELVQMSVLNLGEIYDL